MNTGKNEMKTLTVVDSESHITFFNEKRRERISNTCVYDHTDLVLPFCCCCRWENGGYLIHYPVTKCLIKGMS